MLEEECPVCLQIDTNVASSFCLRCKSRFHTKCIRTLKICPCCRYLEHKFKN